MNYSPGQDMVFVILALISALSLVSEHIITSFIFLVLSIGFIVFEHQIFKYVKSA